MNSTSPERVLLAFIHAVVAGRPLLAVRHDVWLVLHLGSVIPAIPLDEYVLWRRKGDQLHQLLGRAWRLLMMTAALSSFGLKGLTGGLSWIHILSIVVIVMIPRGIIPAMRQNIGAPPNDDSDLSGARRCGCLERS